LGTAGFKVSNCGLNIHGEELIQANLFFGGKNSLSFADAFTVQ
jgi:hypothetical protein